jgi:heptaprenyl diphosphate synthase
MVSQDKQNDQNDIPVKTLWLLISISLSAIEILLPRIPLLPWLKPGLANIITILWIVRFGAKDAILYSLLRSWITGFYFGFSFTTLILSIGGGILSTSVM